uniref:Uncharacterized protein n=1 Tax=Oryza sativa subsp. japonica TaxID=39947 RepID=Q69NB7_ORYSJ|nr:hypothetical protein [Oryza sativa Japonica Group]
MAEGEREGDGFGGGARVYRVAMSVRKPTLGGQASELVLRLAGKTATGRMTPAVEEKREKGRKKGDYPLFLWEKKEGERAMRQEEEELCLHPLEASARSGGAGSMTTAMTAGRFGRARLQGGRRGLRRGRC